MSRVALIYGNPGGGGPLYNPYNYKSNGEQYSNPYLSGVHHSNHSNISGVLKRNKISLENGSA